MDSQAPQSRMQITAEGAGSVAAHEINGPVHVGDVVIRADSYLPPVAVTAPHGTNNLPRPRSSLFVGRDQELVGLRKGVDSHETTVVVQTMHGLGGVGKSALALHYAHTYHSKYEVVWWITADTADSITAGLAGLGFRLNPRLGTSGATSTESSEWAISWLQCHSGWLLILDNVEDPHLAASLVGQTQNGHHLITSRVSVGWHSIGSQIGLDVLSVSESVELLTRMSAVSDEENEKKKVSSELGYLPLALEHAAAYVYCNRVSFEQYLNLLQRVPEKALAFTPAIGTTSMPVTKTWQLTLKSIEEHSDLAISILRLIAWLGPDDIPREILYNLEEDSLEVDNALGLLSAYSMISLTPDSISIHRLVQAVIRTSELEETKSPLHPHARAAMAIIVHINLKPEISPDSWPMWRRLVPHIEALSSLIPAEEASEFVRSTVYYAARFLKCQNQLEPALACADKCVQMANHDLEDDSSGPDILSCMNILGAVLQELGQHERSLEIFQNLVAKSIDERGPLDPFTLSMKNNLASAYQDAGEILKAIEIFERTLREREEVLPIGDPAIATTRHNLAIAYRIAGNPIQSIPILEKVVKDRQALYGEDGVGTLNSMFNLAISYIDIGNLARALRLLKHVLSKRQEIFGPDDQNVIGARRKLGDVYRAAGNSKRAIPIYEEALQSAIRAYGADDGRVTQLGMPLAFAYQDTNEPQKAIPLLRRVVEWQECAETTDSRSIAMARNNLAVAYWLSGEDEVAGNILEQAMSEATGLVESDREVAEAVGENLKNLKAGVRVKGAKQFDIGSINFRARKQRVRPIFGSRE